MQDHVQKRLVLGHRHLHRVGVEEQQPADDVLPHLVLAVPALIDRYATLLLDMHRTFMFGVDRFGPDDQAFLEQIADIYLASLEG